MSSTASLSGTSKFIRVALPCFLLASVSLAHATVYEVSSWIGAAKERIYRGSINWYPTTNYGFPNELGLLQFSFDDTVIRTESFTSSFSSGTREYYALLPDSLSSPLTKSLPGSPDGMTFNDFSVTSSEIVLSKVNAIGSTPAFTQMTLNLSRKNGDLWAYQAFLVLTDNVVGLPLNSFIELAGANRAAGQWNFVESSYAAKNGSIVDGAYFQADAYISSVEPIAAVPEPCTYMLMLGGIGALLISTRLTNPLGTAVRTSTPCG